MFCPPFERIPDYPCGMKRIIDHLTTRDWAILGAGLVLLLALQVAPAKKLLVSPAFTSTPVFSVVDPDAVPRLGEAAETYKTFSESPSYHAAFAVAADGAYGWSDNYTSREMADTAALSRCREDAHDCRIIARIGPTQTRQFDDLPLSHSLAAELDAFALYPGFKALAVSDIGNWGVAWDRSTKADARTSAMAFCTSRQMKKRPKGVPLRPCFILIAP